VPVWVWLLALIPVATLLLGVGTALSIYGVRKYIVNAKQAEARAALIAWADGLAACGQKEGRLPPSTAPVPANLASIAARKYQSTPTEWSEQAHTCAGFALKEPQYFQYRWERHSDDSGRLLAVADLNGDSVAECELELDVTCAVGKCERGSPTQLDAATSGNGAGHEALSGRQIGLCVLFVLAGLASSIASAWLLVVAFQQSVTWGLLSLFVPCAQLVFVVQFWERAKRPFLLQAGSLGTLLVTGVMWHQLSLPAATGAFVATAPGKLAPEPGGRGVKLAPPPPVVPVPELTGAPVDLSTVMGKARKLANEWEQDAALVGIEATLAAGVVPTQEGASAKLTFGPSIFKTAQTKTGLLVVTYDKSGLRGVAAKGPPAKALPEPLCAPESVYARMADGAQPRITLRYGLDANARLAWMGVVVGQPPAQTRFFEPQRCDPMAIVVGSQRR
jgi:hypothetical protein